jgi:hypothetical protein
MNIQTDVQDVLDRLKTAQQKPLGDPRFKSLASLEKSTFSQSVRIERTRSAGPAAGILS